MFSGKCHLPGNTGISQYTLKIGQVLHDDETTKMSETEQYRFCRKLYFLQTKCYCYTIKKLD